MANSNSPNVNAARNSAEDGLRQARIVLLRSQLVDVFDSIKAAGLEPGRFEWRNVRSRWSPGVCVGLCVRDTECYFNFDSNTSGSVWLIDRRPGSTARVEQAGNGISWETLWSSFINWLVYVKREIEAPDVWGIMSQESSLLSSGVPDGENSPFSQLEAQRALTSLQELKQYLLVAHKLDPELVEGRIRYLEGAITRVGRLDWKNIVISAVMGILLNSTVSPEAAHEVLRYVGIMMTGLFSHVLLPS